MNSARLMVVAICALLPWVSSGQTSIVDHFSGFNGANWVSSTFDEHSTVYVDGGLHLIDRARITSAIQFTEPNLVISGRVSFNSSNDIFQVVFRSSGTYEPDYYGEATNGLKIYFGPFFGVGEGNVGLVESSGPGENTTVNTGTYGPGVATSTIYDFMVVAGGPDIAFFISGAGSPFGSAFGAPVLTASTSGSYGNYVGFYNREYAGVFSPQIVVSDFLSVTGVAVPEPGVSAMLAGVAGLLWAWRSRRRFAGATG